MTQQHIEDTLRPTTVIEIALMARIRELRIALMEKGLSDRISGIPQEIDIKGPPHITLNLAAECSAGWEQECFVLKARTYGTDQASIGFASYMSKHQLAEMTPTDAIRWLDDNHGQITHRLAGMLNRSVVGALPAMQALREDT